MAVTRGLAATPATSGRSPPSRSPAPTSPSCRQPSLSAAILAGCKPGGTVLDPFSGSGTTGLAATKHGRKYVGIDLNADYLDLSLKTRFAEPGFDFGEVTA